MNYHEIRAKHEKAISDFPIGFAFSKQQLEDVLEKLSCTKKELVDIGFGGFVRKTDLESFEKLIDDMETERQEFLKDDDNFLEALVYELANHEYCITYDSTDALAALGLEKKKLTDRENKLRKKAISKYWEEEYV